MSSFGTWLCFSALGVAGVWLAAASLHVHADKHEKPIHHAHIHHHGDSTHTHHHAHTESEGQIPGDPDGDDHRSCSDNDHQDNVVLSLPPRVTRTLTDVDIASLDITAIAGMDCIAVALMPPRSPPEHFTGQDSLPQLRTIVLLT